MNLEHYYVRNSTTHELATASFVEWSDAADLADRLGPDWEICGGDEAARLEFHIRARRSSFHAILDSIGETKLAAEADTGALDNPDWSVQL